MFHNYFFLKRLAQKLNEEIKGLFILECFSQNKDELIIQFGNRHKEFVLRANLDPALSLLQFPESFARAGKNSVNLFDEIIDHEVTEVSSFLYERSFQILLKENLRLIFKMHARRANILLVLENQVISIFRNNLHQDLEIDPRSLHKDIELSLANFEAHDCDALKFIPALGKESRNWLISSDFDHHAAEDKWQILQELLDTLHTQPITLIKDPSPTISLLEVGETSTKNPITASNWLYDEVVRGVFFEGEKDRLIKLLKQRIKKSESYIEKTREKLEKLTNERSPEELANILMANLHTIQTGLSKVVLTDFYTNSPITIKLNTTLTPQKNAENYYRKAKNRHQEIDTLKQNIDAKKSQIEDLSASILQVMEVAQPKELRKLSKQLGFDQHQKSKPEVFPYHSFEVDGWTILVGKNSKANDELTLKVANKNDLWLHAKDVAGSHVIIKQQPGQSFPKYIIEYAAGLAAANSKRKTDSLCPVIFTPKKFVRKAKGAPPGQVIVEKEEILMIEPLIT